MIEDRLTEEARGIYLALRDDLKDGRDAQRIIAIIKMHLIDLSLDLRKEHWHNGFAEGVAEGRVRDDK